MTSRDAVGVVGRPVLASCTPDGLDVVQWLLVDGGVRQEHPSPGLLGERLWEASPIRRGSQYRNRRSQYGLYFWAATGEHVWYESGLELACLVALDQRGETARPLRLLFRAGAGTAFHDPDFLAVHGNGDQVLYDMRSAGQVGGKVRRRFDESARVCGLVGWRHRVLIEPAPVRARNLGFLRPARLARCHPQPVVFEQLLGVFAAGRPIGQGAAMANRRHPALAMPYIRHLIWHRRLGVDLDVRLDFDTVAVTNEQLSIPVDQDLLRGDPSGLRGRLLIC